MKSKLIFIHILFIVIGSVLLYFSHSLYISTHEFISTSKTKIGTVTELSGSDVYYPHISFETENDKNINFRSSVGTNPPSYSVGDSVEILYDPKNPQNAQIKSFVSQWMGVIGTGSMGIVFFLIGFFWGLNSYKKKKIIEKLKTSGTRLSTNFVRVERNTSTQINGKSPYIIISEYDKDNKKYEFSSENIWFDPTSNINNETITVLVNPQNYLEYYMDTSFLPELQK